MLYVFAMLCKPRINFALFVHTDRGGMVMKKIAILAVLVCVLSGCGQKADMPVYRVVTGVEVEYHQQDRTILRTYNTTTSMQSILNYLRILRPFGPVNPESAFDSACKITLHYSQGPDSVYIQRGQQYLQKDGGDWETVDSSRASLLYPLLLLLPSDSES